jgi:hypothetical protein
MFLNHFNALMSKIIFKKYIKNNFDIFQSKKHLKNKHNHTLKNAINGSNLQNKRKFLDGLGCTY